MSEPLTSHAAAAAEIARLRAEVAALREALETITRAYERTDINHHAFRVHATRIARAALAAQEQAP